MSYLPRSNSSEAMDEYLASRGSGDTLRARHDYSSGSRNRTDEATMLTNLQRVEATFVIHGGARGVDRLAGRAAVRLGIPVEVYPADWDKYGRSAGFVRNQEMLTVGRPDLVLAFWKATALDI